MAMNMAGLDSYLQIEEDPEELRTPGEEMMNFDLDLSSQRQMLIHTQPIYLINTSKLQTPQHQVIRTDFASTLLETRQSSIFSSNGNIHRLLHEQDEFHEEAIHVLDAAFTPECGPLPGEQAKACGGVRAGLGLRMPRILPREELEYSGCPAAMADDELLFELSAPIATHQQLPPPAQVPGMSFGPSLDLSKFVQAAHTFHDDTTWDSPEQYEFVHTLTSKLSRYCGYFVADSKEMEYFDKIRLQEVEYRLSKTYFT